MPVPGVRRARLLEVIASFPRRRLVALVDLVADEFTVGVPKRVSREAPVLILRHVSDELRPGGGANAVANVRALGGTPVPVGVVGEDDAGRRLVADLEARGIDVSLIRSVPGYRTPTKTRILGGSPTGAKQQIVRIDVESDFEPDEALRAAILRDLAAAAPRADGALLSDYGYGAVRPDLVPPLVAALGAGKPVTVDSRFSLRRFRGLTAATPNEEELLAAVPEAGRDGDAAILAAAQSLRGALGLATLLATRGSRGMLLVPKEGPPVAIPVHGTDQVADVTGAGDTVLAAFSLALASGATPAEAAVLANVAAGIVVMKMGTATASAAELAEAIASDHAIVSS
jgi:rfaE bifunctional protein kinase chain/domain